MATSWFVKLRGEERGPFSSVRLRQMAKQGTIRLDTEVKKGTQGTWVRAGRVKGLFPPSRPGQPFSEDDVLDILGHGGAPAASPEAVGPTAEAAHVRSSPCAPPSPSAMADGPDQRAPETEQSAGDRASVCPACGEDLMPQAVLCVKCGFDLRRGVRLPSQVGSDSSNKQPSVKTRQEIPKWFRRYRSPELVAFVIAGLGLTAFLIIEVMVWENQSHLRRARKYVQTYSSSFDEVHFDCSWFPFSLPEEVRISGSAHTNIHGKNVTGTLTGTYRPAERKATVTTSFSAKGDTWQVHKSVVYPIHVPDK